MAAKLVVWPVQRWFDIHRTKPAQGALLTLFQLPAWFVIYRLLLATLASTPSAEAAMRSAEPPVMDFTIDEVKGDLHRAVVERFPRSPPLRPE